MKKRSSPQAWTPAEANTAFSTLLAHVPPATRIYSAYSSITLEAHCVHPPETFSPAFVLWVGCGDPKGNRTPSDFICVIQNPNTDGKRFNSSLYTVGAQHHVLGPKRTITGTVLEGSDVYVGKAAVPQYGAFSVPDCDKPTTPGQTPGDHLKLSFSGPFCVLQFAVVVMEIKTVTGNDIGSPRPPYTGGDED